MDLHLQCDASGSGAVGTLCQLYIGHEGSHAALIRDDGARLLRRWDAVQVSADVEFTSSSAAELPWAPGRPTLVIADAKPSLAIVAANPKVIPTAKTADLHIA